MGSGIARKTSPRKMSAKREAALKAKGIFPRSTILGERKPVKKRNAKRKASEFARCFGSRERVRFVKSMGCLVCESISPLFGEQTVGKCDNAHTAKEGMGRRGHYSTIVPLCRTHHRWYDERIGFLAEAEVREFISSFASAVEAAWQKIVSWRGAREGGV